MKNLLLMSFVLSLSVLGTACNKQADAPAQAYVPPPPPDYHSADVSVSFNGAAQYASGTFTFHHASDGSVSVTYPNQATYNLNGTIQSALLAFSTSQSIYVFGIGLPETYGYTYTYYLEIKPGGDPTVPATWTRLGPSVDKLISVAPFGSATGDDFLLKGHYNSDSSTVFQCHTLQSNWFPCN